MTTRVWEPSYLDTLREIGDADADAVATAFAEARGLDKPRDLFCGLVQHDPQTPDTAVPAVADWFAARVEPPSWANPTLMAHGRRVFEEHGPSIFAALYSGSLPGAYAARRGVHVLELTGRLVTDAQRRLTETARFHLDVMATDDLGPDTVGLRSIRHVRLMHAGVRWLVQNDPEVIRGPAADGEPHYDPAWGMPVCQEDLLSTLLTFTQVVFDVLEHGGVELGDRDQQAYLHRWCVIGYHLGILDELLPLDLDDTRYLLKEMRRRQLGPSAAGVTMTKALLALGRDPLPRPLKGIPVSSLRHSCGNAVANMLDVDPADWTRHLYKPLSTMNQGLGVIGRTKLLRGVNRWIGWTLVNAMVSSRRDSRTSFEIPRHLAERWTPPMTRARARAKTTATTAVARVARRLR